MRVIVTVCLIFSASHALAQFQPRPVVPPVVSPAPPPVEAQLVTDFQIANPCPCRLIIFVRQTGSQGDWKRTDAEVDKITHIALEGNGPFDILIQQQVAPDTFNEFRDDAVGLPVMANSPEHQFYNLNFRQTEIWKLNNSGQWTHERLEPAPIAKIPMVAGDGIALLVIPMQIRATASYEPPRPIRPKPDDGK